MNLERINEIEKQDEERKAANRLSSTLSNLKFKDRKTAFEFVRNEIKSLVDTHGDLFFLEDSSNELVVSLGTADERRMYIYFEGNFTFDTKTFSVKVGKNHIEYKVDERKNGLGFEIQTLGEEKDSLGFSGIPINDMLKVNLIDTFDKSINLWIFEPNKEQIEAN